MNYYRYDNLKFYIFLLLYNLYLVDTRRSISGVELTQLLPPFSPQFVKSLPTAPVFATNRAYWPRIGQIRYNSKSTGPELRQTLPSLPKDLQCLNVIPTVLFLFVGGSIVRVKNLKIAQDLALWFLDKTSVCTWPSGKLPFECPKIAKNLTF